MKRLVRILAFTVVILAFLSLFGWLVFHTSKGDKDFGRLTESIRTFYTFPDLFIQTVEEVKSLPKTFIKTPEDFVSVNDLSDDLFALVTYSDTGNTRTVIELNLRNDSVRYKWTLDNPFSETDRIKNPLVLPGRRLVYSFAGRSLIAVDSLGKEIWKQDSLQAHHAMNLGKQGHVWVCAFVPVGRATGLYQLNGEKMFFADNYISKVDAETGKILFLKSVTEILVENDLSGYLLKSGDLSDPLHLNDVQPALRTTQYYEEGDLFISLRQPSLILHYRPKTNEVIEVIEGVFFAQHDVDFYHDDALILFNNNTYPVWHGKSLPSTTDTSYLTDVGPFTSNLVRYDFATKRTTIVGDSIFKKKKIYTLNEGLMEFINDSTYIVEEQNSGVYWVISGNNVIYKNVIRSQHEGYHHLPNWIRIIE